MVLNNNDKPSISALSRSDVEVTVGGLKRFARKSMWIGKTNRYIEDVVERLKSDPPLSPRRARNLAQYISASSVLHANDGWSYLGRAIACLMSGDAHRSLHLAYYAELRAGMSLLAGAGIGIFDHRHFLISGPNLAAQMRSGAGTHQIAWAALEFWSQQPSSGALFAKLIRPEGRPLEQWFDSYGGVGALAPQARDWFLQWGMDLLLATKDRAARNESSYRPDGIPRPWSLAPVSVFEFVRELWNTLEPSTPSGFNEIDRYILRLAVERHFQGTHGTQPSATNPTYKSFVSAFVADQGLSVAGENRWKNFLLRKLAPSEPTIFTHSALAPGDPAKDPFAIISRATLLLRVATGSANNLLQLAGFDANALAFWWRSIGEARGLWEPSAPPATLGDLWADINDALQDVERFAADSAQPFQSMNTLVRGLGRNFNTLCSTERVGLWGLCPA